MRARQSQCLGEVTVRAVVAGLVTSPDAERVSAHLEGCCRCSSIVTALETIAYEDKLSVGRYQIKRLIGEGGMGEVYVAHDPGLDREVAVKVLHPRLEPHGADLNDRLVREAMAMARLSHPNVVTVYDVGNCEGQLFIAMELVDGPTLARWRDARPRPGREIVDVFVAAGRGLAAAHGAGIVHGDFKPQNVLIDCEGRAKVTDFGLARLSSARPVRQDARTEPTAAPPSLHRTGELVGTPAYMAPEQLDGAAADTRSDQFAFCVAFYEALCGERPFGGGDLPALRDAMRSSPTWSRLRQGASWRVARAIQRGLAEDPARRFSSMDALLHELTPRRSARTAVLTAAAAGVVAIGLALGMSASPLPEPLPESDPCDRAPGWASATRAEVRQSLLSAGQPESVITHVQNGLDQYASGWLAHCQALTAGPGPIVGVGSGRCLDVRHDSRAPGTVLQIFHCHGGDNQSFLLTPAGELRVFGGNVCVEAGALGAPAVIQSCTGAINQRWSVNSDRTITSRDSGFCLDVEALAAEDRTPVQVSDCNGGSNQKWVTISKPPAQAWRVAEKR